MLSSGIAFIGIGIGVELPLSELELEWNCKNGIDPSSGSDIPFCCRATRPVRLRPCYELCDFVHTARSLAPCHSCHSLMSAVPWP